MRAASYLSSAVLLLNQYDGDIPFAAWLKKYFAFNKKFGSKDRKHITHLCYCYFRASNGFKNLDIENKITYSLFLCSYEPNSLLQNLDETINEKASLTLDEKLDYAIHNLGFHPDLIFPWQNELSDEINRNSFINSFLIQPNLFLRVRPGFEAIISQKLKENGLSYNKTNDCIELPISTKATELFEIDKQVVIQDINSQKTLNGLENNLPADKFKAWDCCAASGGKSLLLHDKYANAELYVSDVRESIIANLKKRFSSAGIVHYKAFVTDVSTSHQRAADYDLIICDAPCSGSGTWSRTPEALHFFQEDKIEYYANLQKKISVNASKSLKQNGLFLYITCSVFKKENEDVVTFLQQENNLLLLNQQYYKGYGDKADTLFTALFRKP